MTGESATERCGARQTRAADDAGGARVGFAGDWHGDAGWARQRIFKAAKDGVKLLVHLGDFGFWYSNVPFAQRVSDSATKYGIEVWVVPGNHEDYGMLERLPVDDQGRAVAAPNVLGLPRGHRFDIDGVHFAAIGGAVSIDRLLRAPSTSWWAAEEITDEQEALAIAGGRADVLLTHDAPSGTRVPLLPRAMRSGWVTPEVLLDAEAHRLRLRRITDALSPKWLLHGHYHAYYADIIDGVNDDGVGYRCRVIGLGQDGTRENLLTARVAAGRGLEQLRLPGKPSWVDPFAADDHDAPIGQPADAASRLPRRVDR